MNDKTPVSLQLKELEAAESIHRSEVRARITPQKQQAINYIPSPTLKKTSPTDKKWYRYNEAKKYNSRTLRISNMTIFIFYIIYFFNYND